MKKKSFTLPIRVYYEDTDSGGVVYHANYLKFMERARTEWLLQSTSYDIYSNYAFAVCEVGLKFLKPAKLHDEMLVVTELEKINHASLIFKQTIKLLDVVCCIGTIKVACVDNNLNPCAIPNTLMQEIKLWE